MNKWLAHNSHAPVHALNVNRCAIVIGRKDAVVEIVTRRRNLDEDKQRAQDEARECE